jgi:hypothetical protein
MATPVTVWGKTRKVLSACVLFAFLFPFFGVSCDGMDVITISGTDLVVGGKPGGLASEVDEDRPGRRSGGVTGKVENVDVEPLAIAALALALVVFGLTWLTSRNAAIGSIAASVAAVGVLIGLWITVQGKLDRLVEESKQDRSAMRREVKIDAGPRPGLFGAALGFLAVAVFTGLALRPQPIKAANAPPGAPPPGGPPGGFP